MKSAQASTTTLRPKQGMKRSSRTDGTASRCQTTSGSASTPGMTPRPPVTSWPRAMVFYDLADAIITVRSLIRQAWTTYRWDDRPARRPRPHHLLAQPS